ncbi:hypothetical protein V1J52_02465 [Streptomyces sp. TRM 70351]|uniref:hypothetical protein n=1 Tax=Streptomyces sp. TRM 70351 TaxID=3116552 RepID=UPI002E7BDC76|nr:hypothetical protein [Streptomyces sp. TRM 70351]MEE1927054.1 hypothetical protein [Streptomyces sp. TRM 70351]
MSTTRHLVNRRRRAAAGAPGQTAARATLADQATADGPRRPRPRTEPAPARIRVRPVRRAGGDGPADAATPPRARWRLPLVLAVLTVLLGGFAVYAHTEASALRATAAARNTALTDTARTSEVKGKVSQAVADVFSYDHTQPGATDTAARQVLTGRAVEQHRTLLAQVREQGPEQKLLLTTTVTHSGVELIEDDRARVLVFADQQSTRTGQDGESTYAAAMFAVEALHTGGTWKIAQIDTFAR